MLERIESAISANDAEAVQDAMFDATGVYRSAIDDDFAFAILAILRRDSMKASQLSAHLFNLFQFEASRLSQRAKDRCAAFLREWGDTFTDSYTSHVIAELRSGPYLLEPQQPKPKKKPRHPKR